MWGPRSFMKIWLAALLMAPALHQAWADDIEIDLGGASTPTPKSSPVSNAGSVQPTPAVSTENETASGASSATSTLPTGSRQISRIHFVSEGNGTRVAIEGQDLPQPSVSRLSARKILMKFSGTTLAIPTSLKGNNGIVKDVRSAMHSKTAWLVFDVRGLKKWQVDKSDDGYALFLNATPVSKEASPETETPEPSANAMDSSEKGPFSTLIDASLKPTDGGEKLVLTSDSPSKYTVRKLSQPEKIIVHFYNTKLEIANKLMKFKNSDPALQKGGLLSVEFRQIGPSFSPISEALLTVLPGTVDQVDRDLNQIVITLNAPPPAPEAPVERKGNLNQLVSMDLQNADMNAVVKTLASEGGFDLDLVSGPVSGVVNQKYKDIPLKTALADLLGPIGYAYDVQGNSLRIGPQSVLTSTKAILPHVTELIAPSGGMTPAQFDSLVRPLLSPSNAVSFEADPVRNMLVLIGTAGDIADYKRAIRDLKLDESTESNRITRVVKINYADPNQLSGILQNYLTPVGKIQVSPANYELVIWETATNMGTLLELINELDRKPPQVLIESNIVEVTNEADLNMGVSWGLNKTTGNPTVGGTVGTGSLSSYGNITFGTVQAGINVAAEIEALETHKKAKIISRPRIATTNGVQAEINEVENIVYTQIQNTLSNGTEVSTTTFQQLPLPIDLKVTPRISDDGTITTQIIASITSQTAVVSGGSAGSIAPPQTDVQTATTTINTKNGETIVIGGLVRETANETDNGIPILSSIPIIGSLFNEMQRTNQKEELVIFITPTLLED